MPGSVLRARLRPEIGGSREGGKFLDGNVFDLGQGLATAMDLDAELAPVVIRNAGVRFVVIDPSTPLIQVVMREPSARMT